MTGPLIFVDIAIRIILDNAAVSGPERPIDFTQALDLVPVLRERAPGEHGHTRCRRARPLGEDLGDLCSRDWLAPLGELDDGPDLESLAGRARDAQAPTQRSHLPR